MIQPAGSYMRVELHGMDGHGPGTPTRARFRHKAPGAGGQFKLRTAGSLAPGGPTPGPSGHPCSLLLIPLHPRTHTLALMHKHAPLCSNHKLAVEKYSAALALGPPPAYAAVLHSNRAAAHQVRGWLACPGLGWAGSSWRCGSRHCKHTPFANHGMLHTKHTFHARMHMRRAAATWPRRWPTARAPARWTPPTHAPSRAWRRCCWWALESRGRLTARMQLHHGMRPGNRPDSRSLRPVGQLALSNRVAGVPPCGGGGEPAGCGAQGPDRARGAGGGVGIAHGPLCSAAAGTGNLQNPGHEQPDGCGRCCCAVLHGSGA